MAQERQGARDGCSSADQRQTSLRQLPTTAFTGDGPKSGAYRQFSWLAVGSSFTSLNRSRSHHLGLEGRT